MKLKLKRVDKIPPKNPIAEEAIEIVIEYERKRGRNPKDVSNEKRGFDVESEDRWIEVKGSGSKEPPFIQFNQYNFKALQKALEMNKEFWLENRIQ